MELFKCGLNEIKTKNAVDVLEAISLDNAMNI